jgi:hypothetical protein
MGNGIHIGHCVSHQHDVVSMIVCIARCGFYADACGDSCQDHLGNTSPPQVMVKRRSMKSAPLQFCDLVVVWMRFQFGYKFGPIGGRLKIVSDVSPVLPVHGLM